MDLPYQPVEAGLYVYVSEARSIQYGYTKVSVKQTVEIDVICFHVTLKSQRTSYMNHKPKFKFLLSTLILPVTNRAL